MVPRTATEGTILLRDIKTHGTTSELHFESTRDLASSLWGERLLRISVEGAPIHTSPTSLSSVFCLAMAPLCWVHGATIESSFGLSDEMRLGLDLVGRFVSDFYGWPRRHPFDAIRITPSRRVKRRSNSLLFSGGVDSLSAAILLNESITQFVNLRNFDVQSTSLSQEQSEASRARLRVLAHYFKKPLLVVETNLADVVRHSKLDAHFPAGCTFWYGLQHVNHAAAAVAAVDVPWAKIFLAGSFRKLHDRVHSCAASSRFVNRYVWGPQLHLVEEFVERQRKVEFIIDSAPDVLRFLRVCYSSGDDACCSCDKCLGTALMIVAGGGDLRRTSLKECAGLPLRSFVRHHLNQGPNHIMVDHALLGRCLSGPRSQRARTLSRMVETL
jgi:hypothetical protein